MTRRFKPPMMIDGREVEPNGKPIEFKGETWQTLTLKNTDSDDWPVWEFSLTTGRLLKTVAG